MKKLLSKDLVIKWLLSKEPMSPKKLKNILYYEYAWFLVFLNSNSNHLIKVIFTLNSNNFTKNYSRFKYYGQTHRIEKKIRRIVKNRLVLRNIRAIYNIYQKYTGNQLNNMIKYEQKQILKRYKVLNIKSSYKFYKDIYKQQILGK